MTGALLQFGGSLLAVLLLSALVSRLSLGSNSPLLSETEARKQASDAIYGYEPIDVALDKAGHAALLSDDSGRIVLVVEKGVHFAVRLLGPTSSAQQNDGVLSVVVDEPGFDAITLHLGTDAAAWAGKIAELKG